MKQSRKSFTVIDIWKAYVKKLLIDNSEWWGKRDKFMPDFVVYRKEGTKVIEVINYNSFRKLMEMYFDRAKIAIIKGDALDMTSGVGKILGRRVERDFRKKGQRRIDWGKTRKQPLVQNEETGTWHYKTLVYNTSDDWCRISWNKTKKLDNEIIYEFKPSAPNSNRTGGFRLEFSNALMRDPLLKYKYQFKPVIYT